MGGGAGADSGGSMGGMGGLSQMGQMLFSQGSKQQGMQPPAQGSFQPMLLPTKSSYETMDPYSQMDGKSPEEIMKMLQALMKGGT